MFGYLRKNLGRALKLIISAFVFFLVLEISARVDDAIKYDAPLWGRYTNNLLRTNDADGLRCNIPNGRFEKWHNNKFGFRGPDFAAEKDEETVRIVCMGTSETYGLYESPGREWPMQLSGILNAYHNYHVINASTVGLPTPRYIEYMEKYVFRFDPDVVILLSNPVGFVAALERAARQEKAPSANPANAGNQGGSPAGAILANLRILPKTKQMLRSFVPTRMLKRYQVWDMQKQVDFLESRNLKGKKALDAIPPESIEKYRMELNKIIEALQAKGIKVILSTYPLLMSPDNLELYPEIFLDNRRFAIDLSYKGMIDASLKADSVVREAAQQYGTGLVDSHQKIPANTDYFADNVHLTDAGAELMAAYMAQHILTNYEKYWDRESDTVSVKK